MKTFRVKIPPTGEASLSLTELLTQASKLDAKVIADAGHKGALWLQKGGKGKILRIRDLRSHIYPNDIVTFYFDPRVLSYPALSEALCVSENTNYGVWLKKAGIMPQGTQAADHTSLLRYVEKLKKKEVYLIHRLDRETEGLMIIGYTSQAAAKLGDLFQKNQIKKTYEAVVLGEIERGVKGSVDLALDDREALTHYESLGNAEGKSLLKVTIETGRLHQIRRHLDGIGHPVIGDPIYGKGNKNRDGLKLLAKSLQFKDPWTNQVVFFEIDQSLSISMQ